MFRNVSNAQPGPSFFQIGTNEKWLSGANHVLGEGIFQLATSLWKNPLFHHLELEADFVALLERDVKVAGIENLPELGMNGAQHLVLIQPRTYGLADLRQQCVLFGPTMCIVRHQVVFQCEAQLQGQSDHQMRAGRAEGLARSMGEQDYAKIILARL